MPSVRDAVQLYMPHHTMMHRGRPEPHEDILSLASAQQPLPQESHLKHQSFDAIEAGVL